MSVITVTPTTVYYQDATTDREPCTARWIQEQVDGPVEAVFLEGDRVMWVHGYGKDLGLNMNPRATTMAREVGRVLHGDWIAGTAVITGRSGPETAPLNDDQLARTYGELAVYGVGQTIR